MLASWASLFCRTAIPRQTPNDGLRTVCLCQCSDKQPTDIPDPIMAESPRSNASHESDQDTNAGNSKNHAAKDKPCPYCQQRFTSSSLGRHLDQYITKKKPDGIHNVEEIRRMRGGITRRTARHSSAKQEGQGSRDSHVSVSEARDTPPAETDLLKVRVPINHLNWHTTGVINDLNTTNISPRIATPSGGKRNYAAYAMGQRDSISNATTTSEEKDTARALELALREVLDNVQSATSRALSSPKPSPFDFDLQSETYPSMVLRLLPTPNTLFSTSPFSTPTSVPIDRPPDHTHLDPLRLKIQTLIHRWKWEALGAIQHSSGITNADLSHEHANLSDTADQVEDLALKHADLAYQSWLNQPDHIRLQQWQLELTRALVTERQKATQAEERSERIEVEAARLSQQVDIMSRCQWPREMALWPPDRRPVGTETARELRKKAPEETWDFEKLLSKWKRVVREDKTRRLGLLASASASQGERAARMEDGVLGQQSFAQMQAGMSKSPVEEENLKNGSRMEDDGFPKFGRSKFMSTGLGQDVAEREYQESLRNGGHV